MLEAYGNIWDIADEGGWDAVVVTTNGFVRRDGAAVMGRGIALEAAQKFPTLAHDLGDAIKASGNHVYPFFYPDSTYNLFSFPVKPVWGPNGEPGWKAKAEIKIILRSVGELIVYANKYDWFDILMPRPGCGYGQLNWRDVKPQIESLLDNRFTVVSWHA